MQKDQDYYTGLLSAYIDDRLEPAQVEELFAFIRLEPMAYRNMLDMPAIQQQLTGRAADGQTQVSGDTSDRIWQRLQASTQAAVTPAGRIRSGRGRQVIWYAAAAAVTALVISVYLLQHHARETRKDEPSTAAAINIAPGGNKATLTLGGGQVILLDSNANGQLAVQGATTITKRAGGLIAYDVRGTGAAVENTLTTPRGGQYRLTLPDGTKVWVNAASSITYPTAFTGKERKVAVKGEVFFEVAQDKDQPFIVEVRDGLSVEVLGTGFNINAYSDEPSIRTTLVSGSVKVRYDNKSLLLRPDQQAQLTGARLALEKRPNMDETLAWRNGSFFFSRTPLDVVMRQLSRWYDIDIVYAGGVPAIRFEGDMKRDLNLSEVLNILRKMEVHCKIEGRRLIVLP